MMRAITCRACKEARFPIPLHYRMFTPEPFLKKESIGFDMLPHPSHARRSTPAPGPIRTRANGLVKLQANQHGILACRTRSSLACTASYSRGDVTFRHCCCRHCCCSSAESGFLGRTSRKNSWSSAIHSEQSYSRSDHTVDALKFEHLGTL